MMSTMQSGQYVDMNTDVLGLCLDASDGERTLLLLYLVAVLAVHILHSKADELTGSLYHCG